MKPYSYKFYATTQEAWDAMYQALFSATSSIYWEVFIFIDDRIGDKFINVLCDKAKTGLQVKVIFDAFGSFSMSNKAVDRLEKAGVDVKFYNRFFPQLRLWRWFSRLWFRNHRKVLIVDENIAFLGGVNVKAEYHSWDDIYLMIAGFVPRPLLRGFAKSYISSGGDKKAVHHLLKPNDKGVWHTLKDRLTFIAHSPKFNRYKPSRKLYITALEMAKESVNVLTPYYAPDKKFLEAVSVARKRGVKVNIFLPLRTDFKLMELIARVYLRLTLKTGANVYILPKMNHGKAITVDGKVGVVGSFNVTNRSFHLDEESGVAFNDQEMVADLNVFFDNYLKTAELLKAEDLHKPGLRERFKEWLSHLFDPYV